jgi:hypothetical protein
VHSNKSHCTGEVGVAAIADDVNIGGLWPLGDRGHQTRTRKAPHAWIRSSSTIEVSRPLRNTERRRLDDEITGNFEVLRAVGAGQFTISGRSPDEMHWQNSVFDPTELAPDTERSDDPVLAFRPHAYAISAKLSTQAPT